MNVKTVQSLTRRLFSPAFSVQVSLFHDFLATNSFTSNFLKTFYLTNMVLQSWCAVVWVRTLSTLTQINYFTKTVCAR